MRVGRYKVFIILSATWLSVLFVVSLPSQVASENPASLRAEYIGSEVCKECHADPELSESGFNIWEESQKEAHLFALTLANPEFPRGTNDNELPPPPEGEGWEDIAYVMGGYGWKATYIRTDGTQITGDANVQYNLESGQWTAYHPGENLSFDVECARCHVTGESPSGSWNGAGEDSLGTWSEIGVRCEGCHGPGSLHATRAFTTPEGETDVLKERCGDCHNNGGKKNPIPALDGYVVNHAQYQELEASRHGEVSFFTCVTCHEPHVALKYPDIVGNTFNGRPLNPIRKDCQECHPSREPNHPTPIHCVDCHMPAANKSAVSIEYANGGARGDIASHLWRINTAAVPRDSMFTPNGDFLRPDASGKPSITLDFACLGCHQDPDETLRWASEHAQSIHAPAGTAAQQPDAIPVASRIVSNYPNPFAHTTTFTFVLEQVAAVNVGIFNSNGQQVASIVSGQWPAGEHAIDWDGTSDAGHPVSSGVYIARMQAGEHISSRKVLLVR